MKYEMIIFDLDGTLWETTEVTHQSANSILKKHGIDKEVSIETINKCMGLSFEECAQNYMPYLEKEEREKLLSEMFVLNAKTLGESGGNVYAGLEETLIELIKKYKLAIVSNCGAGYIESFLSSAKLEKYFVDHMAAAQYKISKSEAIKRVMDQNNIKSAIYVGDTKKDYISSSGAGIDFIQAKYGFGEDLHTEYSINDITELPKLLEKN